MAFPPRNPSLNVNSRSAVNGYISSFGLPSAPVFGGVHPGAPTYTMGEDYDQQVYSQQSPVVAGSNPRRVSTSIQDYNQWVGVELPSLPVGSELTVGNSYQYADGLTTDLLITSSSFTNFRLNLPLFTAILGEGNDFAIATRVIQGGLVSAIFRYVLPRGSGLTTTVEFRFGASYISSTRTPILWVQWDEEAFGGIQVNNLAFDDIVFNERSRVLTPSYISARNAYNAAVTTFNADRLRYQAFIAPANLNPGIPTITVGSRTHNSATIGITKGQYADSTDLDGDAPIPDENTTGTSRTYTGLSPSTTYRVRARARRSLNTQSVPPAQTPIS